MTRTVRYTLFVALLVGVFVAGWQVKSWLDVDTCLDSGGAWDYRTGDCRSE
ncbi:MAG TPA: hypothetical protein VL100_04420 [Croceibacterium sp.]|nr:hypothetical protein [Croceibacterium sp.]